VSISYGAVVPNITVGLSLKLQELILASILESQTLPDFRFPKFRKDFLA
jgi:hypothetical protein